jgi:FG-GAP-like repeat/FG-GAP repeat
LPRGGVCYTLADMNSLARLWMRRIGLLAAVCALVAAVYGAVAYHLRAQVVRFGAEGEAVDRLLGAYGKALRGTGCTGLEACYTAGYHGGPLFGFTRQPRGHLGPVDTYDLAPLPGTCHDARSQLDAVRAYMAGFTKVEHAKLKIFDLTGDAFNPKHKEATCRFWISGQHKQLGRIEDRGVLAMTFDLEGKDWKIASQALVSGDTVACRAPAAFEDVAARQGLRLPIRFSDLSDPAADRPHVLMDLALALGPVASGDLDNDGWTDVLVTTPQESRVLVYRNVHGRFREVTEEAGLTAAATHGTRSILLLDYDNDGKLDIFLGRGAEGNRLFHNSGDGTFEDVTEASGLKSSGPFTYGACAGDFDHDGKLDLCLANYYIPDGQPIDDVFLSENSGGCRLFRNVGGGRFADVTAAAHIQVKGHSLACTFFDANDDGWPDIFVAHDYGTNHLLINQGDGTFVDKSLASGLTDIGNFMGVDVADAQARGVLDVYATKIDSNSRWYWKKSLGMQIEANLLSPRYAWRALVRRHKLASLAAESGATLEDLAREKMGGNSYYQRTDPGRFARVDHGAADAQWAWAPLFCDLESSGYPAIYVTNGWFSGKKPDDF